MKKLVCLLAVIALAAPLYAAEGDPNVAMTCSDEGNQVCRVSFQVLDEDGLGTEALVRGFAMDISVSGNATIEGISNYDQSGDETTAPDNYGVFIGEITFNASDPNKVSDWGTPIATDNITTGGLGTSSITVELASLYDMDVDTPPAQSGVLFDLQLDLHGDSDTDVTITAEPLRGGLVMEDVSSANLVSAGCNILGGCFPSNHPDYNEWLSVGSPDCWCYPRQCYGDVDNAAVGGAVLGWAYVSSPDVSLLASAWNVKEPPKGPGIASIPNGICADIDHAKSGGAVLGWARVSSVDISIMTANWNVKEPPKGAGVPTDCLVVP